MAASTYTVPACVTDYIAAQGYDLEYSAMRGFVDDWRRWYRSEGKFYDYDETDSWGHRYKAHCMSVSPAKRVCNEWASLLMNEQTAVQCEEEDCNEWLSDYYDRTGFWAAGQGLVSRAFGLGTGAWALWLELSTGRMLVRRYYLPMVIPLSWDDDGVTECAFATDARHNGKVVHQLQMHVRGEEGYEIRTALFDERGREMTLEGVEPVVRTGCPTPTFAIVRPAIDNTYVDLSPYGASIFGDAIDAIRSVELCYNALVNEVNLGKMRVAISDSMMQAPVDGELQPIPFGKDDNLVFRRVDSADDLMTVISPTLRTEAQVKAYRTAWQTLGDLTGFGAAYFDVDKAGGVKTATEVAADNSQLMRNIRKHENLLGDAIAQISRAVLHCARTLLGVPLPEEGNVTVSFDDSIITDTAAEKAQDLAEVGVTMNAWEYRVKWYSEDEQTAKALAPGAQAAPMQVEAIELGEAGGGSSAKGGLNGAQTQSLIAIMAQYSDGRLTEGQAVKLIATAVGVSEAEARKILNGDTESIQELA